MIGIRYSDFPAYLAAVPQQSACVGGGAAVQGAHDVAAHAAAAAAVVDVAQQGSHLRQQCLPAMKVLLECKYRDGLVCLHMQHRSPVHIQQLGHAVGKRKGVRVGGALRRAMQASDKILQLRVLCAQGCKAVKLLPAMWRCLS